MTIGFNQTSIIINEGVAQIKLQLGVTEGTVDDAITLRVSTSNLNAICKFFERN